MSPRHRARHRGSAATEDVAQIKATGLAAMLRRNRRLTRYAAVGAITLGATLFVVASLTTQFAGAQAGHDHSPAQAGTPATTAAPSLLLPLADNATPAGRNALAARPVRVKQTAPVSRAVISGLTANGIPNVALNAYRVAAARMDNSDPRCGIDWSLLAGIGREESDHGRFGGARLLANGTSVPRIIGPALDGTRWDYIPAPADGLRLDGDASYAHALGPMQFIPQTWAAYGADANGDGVADVFNINDAALGAARYLCAAGGDLRTQAGQIAAVLAYNQSDQYLAQVLALAHAYHRGIAVTGVPNGNTTGRVDPGADTNVPPVNPAVPTAVDRTTRRSPHTKTATSDKASTSTPSTHPSTASAAPSITPTGTPKTTSSRPGTPAPTKGSGTPTGKTSSPTRTCLIWDLLNPGRCAVYS
ncbi:MAG: lytic murein transglycosylase [Jatrophihabitantaceae bacterium]